jgi:hypothetical protein
LNELLPLVNYYRNYKITKKQIESQIENMEFKSSEMEDTDEISKNLIQESNLSQFWKENSAFVDSCKQKIFNWALNVVKLIV